MLSPTQAILIVFSEHDKNVKDEINTTNSFFMIGLIWFNQFSVLFQIHFAVYSNITFKVSNFETSNVIVIYTTSNSTANITE